MDNTDSFGQWLRQRRKALNLTQKELAQQAGCAEITLRKIEAGDLQPSAALVASLARRLRVAEADLPGLTALARGVGGEFSTRSRLLPSQHPHNLPLPLTSLLGRSYDVAALRKRLLADAARLITLVGPPGVGKTRLALAVAQEVRGQFEDGAFFVRLAAVNDPALVPSAIAQALGLELGGTSSPELQLRADLEGKHLLLVLDNFEQVVAAAPLVADLLRRSPWLHVLATSRQPLGLRGERRIPVQPLALPAAPSGVAHTLSAAEALHYSAVALFAERAKAAQFDFAVTDGNAAAVAEICRRLDGLPLAIELVAARAKLLSPVELLARLREPWLLSGGGLRDVPARQKTLRGAIGWSYDLLSPAERTLFQYLSVFAGGFTLEAAELLCSSALSPPLPVSFSPAEVLDGTALLLDKSLLQRDAGLDDARRYTMLETVREYGLERLGESGDEMKIRQRHAHCLVTLAEESAVRLRTQEQLAWIGRLNLEQDNVRAAISAALAHGWGDEALRLTSAMAYFWHIRGLEGEGRQWIRQALAAAERESAWRHSVGYGRALLGYAVLLIWDAGIERRQALLAEALRIFQERRDGWGMAHAMQNLARLAFEQGDYAQARLLGQQSLELSQSIADPWSMSVSHRTLALVAYQQGNWTAWRRHLHAAAAEAEATGDRWLLGPAWQHLGLDVWHCEGATAGRPIIERSLAAYQAVGNQVMVAALSNKLGEVASDQGDYILAQASCLEALDILRVWRDDWESAWTLYCLGSIAFRSGDLAAAHRWFAQCLEACRSHEHDAYRWLEGFVLAHRGRLALVEGKLTEAAGDLERSWRLLGGRSETQDLSLTALGLGELACQQEQWPQAVAYFRFSLAKLRQVGRAVNTPACCEGLAKAFTAQGQPAPAARLWGCAAGLRQRLGTPVPLVERAGHEKGQSTTSERLGQVRFEALRTEGRRMTLDETADYLMAITREYQDVVPSLPWDAAD